MLPAAALATRCRSPPLCFSWKDAGAPEEPEDADELESPPLPESDEPPEHAAVPRPVASAVLTRAVVRVRRDLVPAGSRSGWWCCRTRGRARRERRRRPAGSAPP